MTIVSNPNVTVNIVPATTDISNQEQQLLVVGQMLSGSVTSGELQENILNDNSEDTLFGANSQIAGMIREIKKINQVTKLDAIGLADNGSGVDATGNVTFSGTATAVGSFDVVVGSKTNHKYTLPVAIGDTASDIGDDLVTAMTADLDLPAAGVNTAGDVEVTAANAGTIGNFIGLSVTGSATGITAAVTTMASGATDPVLTDVFDVVGDKRYQTIVWPYEDTSEVVTFLDARFNVSNKVLDGIAVSSQVDSLANTLTALGLLNSQSLAIECDKLISTSTYVGPAVLEIPYVKASQIAAIRALRRTDGANIAQYVITRNGALDSFGGPALSSKPYFNTPMANLPVSNTGIGFTDTEIEQIKDAGGFVIGNNTAANSVILGEVLTTYKTDSAGNDDPTFKYMNYVDTASSGREYFFNNLRAQFAQSRLTEGDLVEGRDMANANSIAAYCTKLYSDLSGEDYVLTQSGEAALTFFNDNLSVSVDLLTGTATILMSVPIVTQLRTIVATFKIEFSTNG